MEDKKIYSKFREDEEGSELCHSSLALPDHLLHFSCSTLPLPTMKRWKGQSQQPWIKQAAHAGRNKNSPFHLLSVKHCQAGGDLSTLHLPQVTSAANPVLHDISRVTLYSCPGQQFHLNKQSRKYRKHYSSEQEGKTHCQINTVKRSSQAASAFPTAAYRHFSTEKLQDKDTRSSFPRTAKCCCLGRTAHSPREACMLHPEPAEEWSQDPCSKSSHIWPSQGKDFPIYSW